MTVKSTLLLLTGFAVLPALALAGGLDDLKPVSNTELDKLRGGFFTAEGANFDFGANITTLVNGELALQSTVTWTPTGPVVQTVTGNIANSTVIPEAELTALGNGSATIAANGLRINSATGTTDVISNLSSNQVQSLIVNTASGQTIAQNTAISMTIYNFTDWQQQVAQQLVGSQLIRDSLGVTGLK